MFDSLSRVTNFHPTPLLNFSSLILILWFGLFLAIRSFGFSPYKVLEYIPLICPFRTISGIPCPGCGMTRAFLALAEGDFLGALRFNPLSVPLFAALVISAFNIRLPIPQRAKNRFLTIVLFVVIFWWFWARFLPGVLIGANPHSWVW